MSGDLPGFSSFFFKLQRTEKKEGKRERCISLFTGCKYLLARNLRISLTDQRAGTDTILKG
jgi:hypothetical protein